MTSPTSGSASLPNVSGHGMSQSPSTPNSANSMGPGQGGLPNLNPMQMKTLQMPHDAAVAGEHRRRGRGDEHGRDEQHECHAAPADADAPSNPHAPQPQVIAMATPPRPFRLDRQPRPDITACTRTCSSNNSRSNTVSPTPRRILLATAHPHAQTPRTLQPDTA